MKKVKRMMFGGVSKAVGKSLEQVSKMPGGVNKNAPPNVQKMMANLPRGSTVAGPGTGLAPKPGMTGLGTAAQVNPKIAPKIGGMLGGGGAGLGAAQANPKTMSGLGGIGAALGRKMGMKKGGSVSSASKRADGIAAKGKTKGRMV
jgi:hypothetical protein